MTVVNKSLVRFLLVLLRKDAEDLQAELEWGSSRPESRWKLIASSRSDPRLGDVVDGNTVWEECLTSCENKFYLKYMDKFPDSCYSLNQDPDHTPMYARGKAQGYGT